MHTGKRIGIYWSYTIYLLQETPQMTDLSVAQYFHFKEFMTYSLFLAVLRKKSLAIKDN